MVYYPKQTFNKYFYRDHKICQRKWNLSGIHWLSLNFRKHNFLRRWLFGIIANWDDKKKSLLIGKVFATWKTNSEPNFAVPINTQITISSEKIRQWILVVLLNTRGKFKKSIKHRKLYSPITPYRKLGIHKCHLIQHTWALIASYKKITNLMFILSTSFWAKNN